MLESAALPPGFVWRQSGVREVVVPWQDNGQCVTRCPGGFEGDRGSTWPRQLVSGKLEWSAHAHMWDRSWWELPHKSGMRGSRGHVIGLTHWPHVAEMAVFSFHLQLIDIRFSPVYKKNPYIYILFYSRINI